MDNAAYNQSNRGQLPWFSVKLAKVGCIRALPCQEQDASEKNDHGRDQHPRSQNHADVAIQYAVVFWNNVWSEHL